MEVSTLLKSLLIIPGDDLRVFTESPLYYKVQRNAKISTRNLQASLRGKDSEMEKKSMNR